MASLLSNLKKQRQQALEKATKSMEAGGGQRKEREVDSRFWKLKADDQGNAGAVIRFLPNVHEGDELPWVKVDRFAFKGPTGKWYINNSLRTIGQEDPVSKDNSRLWNEVGTDEAKAIVKTRKVQPKYIFNIYVIKDVNNPENEGKVFLYEAGKQVFGWIQEKAQPEDDPLGDTPDPIYVWDLWEGANFRFKAYKEGEYLKYDKSTFDSPSEFLGGDEAKIEEVLAQCHKLNQFVAPENFKSYDDLQRQLDLVMGNSAQKQEHSQSKDLDDLQKLAETSKPKESAKKPKQESPAKEEKVSEPATSTGDDDDTLNYFKSLLNDD
jgi:hypothetical protein